MIAAPPALLTGVVGKALVTAALVVLKLVMTLRFLNAIVTTYHPYTSVYNLHHFFHNPAATLNYHQCYLPNHPLQLYPPTTTLAASASTPAARLHLRLPSPPPLLLPLATAPPPPPRAAAQPPSPLWRSASLCSASSPCHPAPPSATGPCRTCNTHQRRTSQCHAAR